MYFKEIEIINYRRFKFQSLDFENDVTFIAGPNNCGKTSLMTFIKDVIMDRINKYSFYDLPISIQKNLFNEYYNAIEILKSNFEKEQEGFEQKFTEIIKNSQTELRINIEYKETDDIKLFSPYIMDLDKNLRNIYFSYIYKINCAKCLSDIFENRKKLIDDVDLSNIKSKEKNKKEIIKIFNKNLETKIYYCDANYQTYNIIEKRSEFLNLFNVVAIQANRPLDDIDDDKNYGLSSTMIKILKSTDSWDKEKEKLVESIEHAMTNIKEQVQLLTDNALVEPLKQVEETSGSEKTKITLSLNPKSDDLEKFIVETMEAVYDIDGIQLGENSQGLGYSNLIFIHLILESFIKKIDSQKINFFIIEEPESHMHPQMQRTFIKHFINEVNKTCCQGLVSTHSNEIVKASLMHRIRVIRKEASISFIKSLKPLLNIDENDNDEQIRIKNFFDYFFDIAFSDIIFADKAVFYEGDTERLYLQNIIKQDKDLESLSKQYVSYIQVGGAYAHNYHKIIELLNIRSLIITDIDYSKESIEIEKIKNDSTTNCAIKYFYKLSTNSDEVLCKNLYKWHDEKKNIIDNLIFVAFQSNCDNYARTLEEAMICKQISQNIEYKLSRNEWEKIRNDLEWKFSLPKSKDLDISIRDILKSTSGNKTDFMYSVVLSKKVTTTEPLYIKEGLEWLMK